MGCCGKIFFLVITALAVFIGIKINSLYYVPPTPKLENTWWGPGSPPAKEDTSIKPFKINVPDEILTDLKTRLDNARPLIPPLEGIQQQYGINTNLLKEVLEFWKISYNWREREQFLNTYPQYTTNIQGLKIHYIRVKPQVTSNVKVLPLLLLHGWPGSVREFYEIIPMLTKARKDKDFVFELIVPSLPGYGFSEAAAKPGLGAAQMGVIFKNLMKRLGYEKYYIQGGDWGATIVANMATLYPEHILGVHSNMCTLKTTKSMLKLFIGYFCPSLSDNNMYPLSKTFSFLLLESGYFHLQATKPDTVGVALNDSPVGLLAYILEKFTTWTNPEWKTRLDGGLLLKYTYTNLLDNIMIYWVSGSITTSMRMYAETTSSAQSSLGLSNIPIEVPSACAKFPNELYYQSNYILRDKYNQMVQTTDFETGGHFAAFEEPKLLADDIWSAVEKFQLVLLDLKNRLSKTRDFVPPLEGIQQQYGMNTNLLKDILDFWKTKYNWREREQYLNSFPQYTTSIQGLKIHYIHVKPKTSPNVKVVPMVLLHGWPGSVREFYEMIPMLTTVRKDRNFVFEVIVPSLPGYGFSEAAAKPGLGAAEMSVVFNNLMKRLGFEKYYAQGGDWGAMIVSNLGIFFPNNVLGIHSNMCFSDKNISYLKLFLGSIFPSLVVDKDHEHLIYPLSNFYSNLLLESGYFHLQATKPDTVGVALNESPIGLAAYIIEKFTTWTNKEWKSRSDGGLQLKYTYTNLLDNIMIYWVTGSITTSMRMYSETMNSKQMSLGHQEIPVQVPTACALPENELFYSSPGIFGDKYKQLIRSTHIPNAGHFAAFEEPKLLANDIWASIDAFLKLKN